MNEKINTLMEDQASRHAITSEIFSNFFVEAGAGSGKTTQLVARMVAMVEAGIEIDKICAITFTKAAAKEFYHRFQASLAKRCLSAEKEIIRKRCEDALSRIDLCFMGTIDSFCNMVLSEHPMEAHIPSHASIQSDDEMKKIYRREYSKIKKGEYGEELRKLSMRFSGLHRNAEADFIELLNEVMGRRNAQFICPEYEECSLDVIFSKEKKALTDIVRNLLSHEEYIYTANKTSLAAYDNLKKGRNAIYGSWDDNAAYVMKAIRDLAGLRLTPGLDLSRVSRYAEDLFVLHEGKGAWYEVDQGSSLYLADQLEEMNYALTMKLVTMSVPLISDTLRREGKLSYFDYLLYLRDMLKEDAAKGGRLIRHIYERHSYFLIDEFQDTNPMQAEVFFYLTAIEPLEDWTKCVPRPGSLFIVGDPKQSIYRFRDADVTSFIKVRSLFTGSVGRVLTLSRNFRSVPVLCRWFNDVFSDRMPADTKMQCRFHPIPVDKVIEDESIFQGIYRYACSGGKAPSYPEDDEMVGSIVAQLVHNPEYMILKGDNKEVLEYEDIMLIARTKTHLGKIISSLYARGIPFFVEGKVLFSDCPALLAISRIFGAIARPWDKFHTYGCEEDFASLVNEAREMTAPALFRTIMERFDILERYGVHNLEYVYYALELLRTAEDSAEAVTIYEQAKFLENLLKDETTVERCISLVRNQNRVHIANLHKVKGLEAPVVILCSPKYRELPPKVHTVWENPPKCWILNGGGIDGRMYEKEMTAEKEMQLAENDRLIYVAATRAKNALIIGDAMGKNGDSLKSNPWKPLIERGPEVFEKGYVDPEDDGEKNKVDARSLKEAGKTDVVFQNRKNSVPTYAIRRPSQIRVKDKIESDREEREMEKNLLNGALAGTLVHRMMEVIISSKNSYPKEQMAEDILREHGVTDERFKEMLLKVYDKVTDGELKYMMDTLLSADKVYCEVPFSMKEGDTIWNGIMDVVYMKEGQWHIVDYKTNYDASDLDEKYQEQLTAYRKAFYEITGEEADSVIWHIDI